MKRQKTTRLTRKRKNNINLYIPVELLDRIAEEAEEFGAKSISQYVAVLLSHRGGIVERIRTKDIIIIP